MDSNFVYRREVNKSVLYDGFGVDRNYLNLFFSHTHLLNRGEKRNITFLLNGISYPVVLKNLNNPQDRRKNDAYQVRYPANGEFAKALQAIFYKTYHYIQEARNTAFIDSKTGRQFTRIPEHLKEYLAIYATSNDSVFICEPIVLDELEQVKSLASNLSEHQFESLFNLDLTDDFAGISEVPSVVKIRKLNRNIGTLLKKHYQYRCQICGRHIGEHYGSNLIEAHHIDYFVKSFNNDMSNILIVCPNHHGIIHDTNPRFDRKTCTYKYPNGYQEGLVLNDHLDRRT